MRVPRSALQSHSLNAEIVALDQTKGQMMHLPHPNHEPLQGLVRPAKQKGFGRATESLFNLRPPQQSSVHRDNLESGSRLISSTCHESRD